MEQLNELISHPEPAILLEISAGAIAVIAIVAIVWLRTRGNPPS
jgi:hypothetical protein